MSTALAKPSMGGGLISRDALRAGLGHVAAALPKVATGGIDFAKMDKTGDWTYGQDNTPIDPDSLWAINPSTLQHGWIAWKKKMGQEPIGEVMVSAMRPLPAEDTLTPVTEGDGWKQQYGVELVCIAGENEGAHILYKQTTTGALKLFNVYIGELGAKLDEPDNEDIVAIVTIGSESYDHKEYGETWNPIFHYVEWRNPDDVSTPEVAAAAPKEEAPKAEAPKRTRKPAAEKTQAAGTTTQVDAAAAAEPKQEEGEDDDDFAIRQLQYRKLLKAQAAAAEAAPAAEAEPVQEEGEDDDDFAIRQLQHRKSQKMKLAGTSATETAAPAADATPRRRERRTA